MTATAQLQNPADPHGLLELLTIEHVSFTAPVRLVNDTRDWTCSGNVFTALPFSLKWPNQISNETPRAQLQITNVGRDLTAILEALPVGDELLATLQTVSRAAPDVVIYEFVSPLTGVQATPQTVSAQVGSDAALRLPCVALRADPSTLPGLFAV